MNTVYIITRDRYNNLKKIVPRWLDQGFHVFLVIEESERGLHLDLCDEMQWMSKDVSVIYPQAPELGVGYARAFAVWHASKCGLKSIIMSDDDMRPSRYSRMELLLREAEKPGVLGVGATTRIHDHFTRGGISRNSGVILCPSGWGMQLFALNISMARDLGNFDRSLDCFAEDHELMRTGISAGIPWLVHCDVNSEPIGTRYSPGGLATYTKTLERRKERELICHTIVHNRWPKYVSKPPAKMRVAWQKMLNDYIPNWKERSALHGGTLR